MKASLRGNGWVGGEADDLMPSIEESSPQVVDDTFETPILRRRNSEELGANESYFHLIIPL